MKKNLLFIH